MRTLFRLLAVVAFVAGILGFLANRQSGAAASADAAAGEACPADRPGCRPDEASEPEPGLEMLHMTVDSLVAARVCPDAGYLCAGFEERGTWRVLRWDEETPLIRLRIPLPPIENRGLARELQAAAARGIRTWHRHPFPLKIDLSDRPGDHDVTVRWTLAPRGRELGHASTRWRRSREETTLRVDDFALAVRNPFDPTRALSPEQVELTAAHEMGHALGLPHSDREDDVMYPSNTATRLTSRDFRTMEALYRLGNGAEIVKP